MTGGDAFDHLVDAVAAAVLGVPGVESLHGGAMGEIAAYLPGRRVPGLRVADDLEVWEVHVTLVWDPTQGPITSVAEGIRHAVRPLAGDRPIKVVVEDIHDGRSAAS